jgi:hypothetical protein
MRFARDPRELFEEMRASGGGGVELVRGFLRLWEDGEPGAFVSVAQAMVSSPIIADAAREFLIERVWSQDSSAAPDAGVRRALVSSQLMGTAWTRYVLRLEPLASADIDTVAALVGPTIDRYLHDPLPDTSEPSALSSATTRRNRRTAHPDHERDLG